MSLAPAHPAMGYAEIRLAILAQSRPGWRMVTERREQTEESPQPGITITVDPKNIGPLPTYSMTFHDDHISLTKGPGTVGYAMLANDKTDAEAVAGIVKRLETNVTAEIEQRKSLLPGESRVVAPSTSSANEPV